MVVRIIREAVLEIWRVKVRRVMMKKK
jgi:hypothetical protein